MAQRSPSDARDRSSPCLPASQYLPPVARQLIREIDFYWDDSRGINPLPRIERLRDILNDLFEEQTPSAATGVEHTVYNPPPGPSLAFRSSQLTLTCTKEICPQIVVP